MRWTRARVLKQLCRCGVPVKGTSRICEAFAFCCLAASLLCFGFTASLLALSYVERLTQGLSAIAMAQHAHTFLALPVISAFSSFHVRVLLRDRVAFLYSCRYYYYYYYNTLSTYLRGDMLRWIARECVVGWDKREPFCTFLSLS